MLLAAIVALFYVAAFPPVRYLSIFIVVAAPDLVKDTARKHPYIVTAIIWLIWPVVGIAAYYPLFHGRR